MPIMTAWKLAYDDSGVTSSSAGALVFGAFVWAPAAAAAAGEVDEKDGDEAVE